MITSLPSLDSGILILNKGLDLSSQKAVSRVKSLLGVKKAGHTGTLDPLATGVLPIALGEATKVIPYLDESKKVYLVTALLGVSTDTYDSEGKIQKIAEKNSETDQEKLLQCLKEFQGHISQKPPPFSAIKINGKPLYYYARKNQPPDIPERPVQIFDIQIKNFNWPRLNLKVECSRGTYIRSLIHDLGLKLGCFAHVVQLKRVQSGPFTESQSLTLNEILNYPKKVENRIFSIEDCLSNLPALDLCSETEMQRVQSGVPLHRLQESLIQEGLLGKIVALKYRQKIMALIEGRGGEAFAYKRVLKRS